MNTSIQSTTQSNVARPTAGDTAENRMNKALDELDELARQLNQDDSYEVQPLSYKLPADFKLSVVIPVYNEEKTLHRITGRVRSLPLPIELVLVDDCSTDGTHALLREMESAGIKVVYHDVNQGKGAALRTGFQHTTGDVVVIQDADLEYDPRDIPQLLQPLVEDRADVVYGSRFLGEEQQDPSFLHRLGNRMLTAASNLFTGLRLTDMETCYKAFNGDLIRSLTLRQNRFGFEPEVTAKIARRKQRVCELPISYNARGYEEGKKIGIRDAFNALWCILRYGLAD